MDPAYVIVTIVILGVISFDANARQFRTGGTVSLPFTSLVEVAASTDILAGVKQTTANAVRTHVQAMFSLNATVDAAILADPPTITGFAEIDSAFS